MSMSPNAVAANCSTLRAHGSAAERIPTSKALTSRLPDLPTDPHGNEKRRKHCCLCEDIHEPTKPMDAKVREVIGRQERGCRVSN